MLNRFGSTLHGDIVFSFEKPNLGMGAWLFDEGDSTAESFVLQVTEAGGGVFTSPVLESGNGSARFVEGFVGVTSTVGITEVRFRVVDAGTGSPVLRPYVLDHLQFGPPIPTPGAIALGSLGTAVVMYLRRRHSV